MSHEHRVGSDFQVIEKPFQILDSISETIAILVLIREVGETTAYMVYGDDPVGSGQLLDQLPEVEGPGRITMDTDDGAAAPFIDIMHVDARASIPELTSEGVFFVDE